MRLTSLVLSIVASSQLVGAWGEVGHRTVGYLAEMYFSQEANDFVSSLLENDKGYDISDAAVWADIIKRHRPYSSTWHYIDAQDNPPVSCGITYNRDCQQSCVVSAIVNQTSFLLDASADPSVQKDALMWVIHFIGDIHQPLHTEDLDRGGNGIHVCFDNLCRRENLHSIWDTDIVHKINGLHHSESKAKEKTASKEWARSLYQGTANIASECSDVHAEEKCVLEWATETNQWVCKYVLKNGVDWLESHDLGGEYYEGAVDIVNTQISNAGLRLAAWINAIAAERSSQGILVDQQAIESFEL